MRVSLIVPTRNSARTLAACLESCSNQTHEDVEVIVVDNSSTDGTVEIAHELADLVLDQKPERSAQRNRGAAESTGDIVVFIDSDMVLEPTVVADFVEVFAHMAETSGEIKQAEAAERERLAPLLAEAGRRVLEGTERLANIPGEIAYVGGIAEAARKKYESAGLSATEIEGLISKLASDNAQRAADLKEEQARLAAEVETLGTFLRTRDASALPEDFAPRPAGTGITFRPAVANG